MYQPFYFLTFLKNYDIIYIERKKERKKRYDRYTVLQRSY